jgi:nitrogen-specific signal transduction histidine kinase/CheY-like chemotaxis protein
MTLYLFLAFIFLLFLSSIVDELRIRRLRSAKKEAEYDASVKSTTLAILSHEIRNPLTGFLSIIKLLEKSPLDENQMKLLHTMGNSGQDLLSLLNTTLTQAQIEKKQLQIDSEDFSISELADYLFTLLNPNATEKGLLFTIQIDQTLPAIVQGDRTKVQQILINLLGNAIKFTQNGIIKLQITASHPQALDNSGRCLICFSIIDSGIGVSEEMLQQIFLPFCQEREVQRRFGGTGLGLSVSRTLAHAMYGKILVSSQQGVGSTFTLSIPLLPASSQPASQTPALQVTTHVNDNISTPTKPLRLLVVDDSDIHLIASNCLLESLGHQVTPISSAIEAIQLLRWQAFDCVFLDIHMPDLDGISTMQQIRQSQQRDKPEPFIVILTAYLQQEDVAKLLSSGADAVCSKPLDLACVSQILANLLAGHKKPGEKFTAALSPRHGSRIS